MKIVASNDFGPTGFKWLTLKRITWSGPDGKPRFWESCERTTRSSGGVDGVAILARISSKTAQPQVIIERQYRPPLSNFVLELPAGLIDEGETAAQAASRELLEETGYCGITTTVTPVCYCDPGITNANMQVALIEVDGDAPENRNVQPNTHDGEFIHVELAPYYGLYSWLLQKQQEYGCEVDARLLSLALGLYQMEQQIQQKQQPSSSVLGMMNSMPSTSSTSSVMMPFGSPVLDNGGGVTDSSRCSTAQSNAVTGGAVKENGIGLHTIAANDSTMNTTSLLNKIKEVVTDEKYIAGVVTAAAIGSLLVLGYQR